MTVEANIVLRRATDAVLVPPAAVREGGRVFVVEEGRARARAVRLGVQGPQAVEVRSGLLAGEVVVLDPPPGLGDGQAVRLRGGAAP